MGAFVLGVLVGWLAEWLFYTFWVKAGDNSDDCSAIKAELDLKNRQISSLQSQLASISENNSDKSSTPTKAASTQNSKKKSTKAKSTASTSKQSVKTSKASSKASSTSTAKAKTTSTKNTKSKTAPKKTTSAKRKSNATGDDFTKLTGIGPSMSSTLKSLGIDTFSKLAATDDDILRDMLEQSDARMNNNKEDMDSWNEQATVAATGDFKALKAMQAALKK